MGDIYNVVMSNHVFCQKQEGQQCFLYLSLMNLSFCMRSPSNPFSTIGINKKKNTIPKYISFLVSPLSLSLYPRIHINFKQTPQTIIIIIYHSCPMKCSLCPSKPRLTYIALSYIRCYLKVYNSN